MKTKEEIKEEIIELYGATQALSEAMNFLHAQRIFVPIVCPIKIGKKKHFCESVCQILRFSSYTRRKIV